MSTPDLISRAACFFVLAEQASRLGGWSDKSFWELSAPPVVETAAQLPALTAAVRNQDNRGILDKVAFHPLPDVLPPEATLWHDHLVAAWGVYRASSDDQLQNIARLALVRLDGCGVPDGHERPSRLPEWLAEARKIASGEWRVASDEWEGRPAGHPYRDLQALAALASWNPSPQIITPPETLREWVDFWLKLRQSENPVKRALAAIALLNLPEAVPGTASISPVPTVKLLHEDVDYLSVLDWQPVTGPTCPVAEVKNLAQSWLGFTRHKEWRHRRDAWRQLIRWDGAGRLDICGIDLLPELVKAIQTEEESGVLREMSRWAPTAQCFISTGTPNRRSHLQQLEGAWERHRTSRYVLDREAAWLAAIRLHQAGLASEPAESFLKTYLSRVADEWNQNVLFILAHWSPGADAPEVWHREWRATWQQRLMDKNESIQQTAAWALLRQSLKKEPDRSLRGTALELWRVGKNVSPEVRDILGAAFVRLQEVRAYLAAGEVPKFEKKLPLPAERHRPPLALPPGRIADNEWKMENEELKMKNGEWRMQHQEATPKLNPRLVPDRPSRSGMSE